MITYPSIIQPRFKFFSPEFWWHWVQFGPKRNEAAVIFFCAAIASHGVYHRCRSRELPKRRFLESGALPKEAMRVDALAHWFHDKTPVSSCIYVEMSMDSVESWWYLVNTCRESWSQGCRVREGGIMPQWHMSEYLRPRGHRVSSSFFYFWRYSHLNSHWCLVGNGGMGLLSIVILDHFPHSLLSTSKNLGLARDFGLRRWQRHLVCQGNWPAKVIILSIRSNMPWKKHLFFSVVTWGIKLPMKYIEIPQMRGLFISIPFQKIPQHSITFPTSHANTFHNYQLWTRCVVFFSCFHRPALRRIWSVWKWPKSCATTSMISSEGNFQQATSVWRWTCHGKSRRDMSELCHDIKKWVSTNGVGWLTNSVTTWFVRTQEEKTLVLVWASNVVQVRCDMLWHKSRNHLWTATACLDSMWRSNAIMMLPTAASMATPVCALVLCSQHQTWRRDPVLELQFKTPLRVVLLCFATQCRQIAL